MGVSAHPKETTRLGGGLLVMGTLVMMAGAAVPFFSPSLSRAPWTDDPQTAAALIAGNPGAYAWSHGLFLAAILITTIGLVPLSLGFKGRSRHWAWMGLVAFGMAAVCSAIGRTINIEVFTWGALNHLDPAGELAQVLLRFQTGLERLTHMLAYLAIGLFGVGLVRRPEAGSLGWLFVAGGMFGLIAKAISAPIPAFVFFGTGALGVATWWLDPDSRT